MTYKQALLKAELGADLLLPGWVGYFFWDYGTHQLKFRNGNYFLDSEQLKRFRLNKRTDWYTII